MATPLIIGATDSGVPTTFQVVRSGTGITAGVEAASASISTPTAATGIGTHVHADNGYLRHSRGVSWLVVDGKGSFAFISFPQGQKSIGLRRTEAS